jgi:cytosine/adenosine deaminase-related metal-dependent hydrolase
MNALAIKARYVFPVDQPPIAGGVVTIADGRIVAVGENTSGQAPLDLGNLALLPGLINAHTHLEFSDLTKPLGPAGTSITPWLDRAITYRRSRESQSPDPSRWLAEAVSSGLGECQKLGITALGEIAQPNWPQEAFSSSPIDCTIFLEMIGLAEERAPALLVAAREHVAAGRADKTDWRAGLGPHAPYSVHPELLSAVCRLSREQHVPVAFHLAESAEELDLLATGGGPFVDLLKSLDAWQPDVLPGGCEPMDYLKILREADRALIIHGTYLSTEEMDLLGGAADRMSVVYCPRTHAHFGHRPYPLAEMLSRGVNVALGTDSRASSPDLSVLSEMRFICRHYTDVSPADVLRMGTLHGARSLGLQQDFGSLAVGKRADFAAVGLPDSEEGDPFELLFNFHFSTQRLCFVHGHHMKANYRRQS